MYAQIYLKSLDVPEEVTFRDIAHEGAHNRHIHLPESFSMQWMQKFPIKKGKNWKQADVAQENGLLSPYAAIDYTRDLFVPIREPCNLGTPRDVDGIAVFIHDQKGQFSTRSLKRAIDANQNLLEGVQSIHVYGGLQSHASVYFSQEPNDPYKARTEDVAVHCELFRAAAFYPQSFSNVFHGLSHPKVRERLEMLVDFVFIPLKEGDRLLNTKPIAL